MRNNNLVKKSTGVRMCLVLLTVLALLFAIAGCGPASNGDTNEDSNGSGNGDPDGSSNGDNNGVAGKNTDLPVFPGATRVDFYEVGATAYQDIYVVTADFDDVVAYYVELFDTWEGVGHGVGLYGEEDDYAFEYLTTEDTSKGFTLVLTKEDPGKVGILYLANIGHYE
ncbi:MAG: hypothetical protein ACOX88_01025 [Christensenellales bacterium]|jgi:hypothetical protein